MSDIQDLTAIVQNPGESSYKRRDAFTKLTRLAPPDLIDILTLAITDDGDRYLNQDIVKHLAGLKSSDCFEALDNALAIDDPYVKTYAIQGLGDIGDPRAVERLLPFLNDRSYSIKSVAEQAIDKLGGPPPRSSDFEETIIEGPPAVSTPALAQNNESAPEEMAAQVEESKEVQREEPVVEQPEVEPVTGPEPQGIDEGVAEKSAEPELEAEPGPQLIAEGSTEAAASPGKAEHFETKKISQQQPNILADGSSFDETALRRFFGDDWETVKPIYVEFRNVSASIPDQEAQSLEGAQGLQSFHADKDDDIAELDNHIKELKQQLGRQDISINGLNDKITDIQKQLASPFIGIANMFFRKKEILTLELNNHRHMRDRLTKSSAANKKELKEMLVTRKKLAAKLSALEEQNDTLSGKLKTMLDRFEAVDRQLDDCYENAIFSIPKKELLERFAAICGTEDKLAFMEHCLNELVHELQELKRNRELFEQCSADLSEEQKHCFAATNSLATEIGSGFKLNKDKVRLEFDIYGQLNFEEKSTFWSGFSNVDGVAAGTGTARTEFAIQKIKWSEPEGFDGCVKGFVESWKNLGEGTAQSELIHSMIMAGKHTVKDYVRLIRNQVEADSCR